MKRLIVLTLLSLSTAALFADDDLDFYTTQFNNAITVSEQLAVVKTVINQEISDADTFYVMALDTLLSRYPNFKTQQDRNAADDMAQYLVMMLGNDKYTDAAPNVWKVVKTFSNAMVKSDALLALGEMNATDLLPQVVQVLTDTNTHGPVNRTSGERIAYGAISSLASYNDPSAYVPIFFAANGWYRSWVRKAAQETLSQLQEDPTEQLTAVIKDASYNHDQKLLALKSIDQSSTSDENKAQAAVDALMQGWVGGGFAVNADSRHKLYTMRKTALSMINKYGVEDASILSYINRSYRYASDEEEQFYAVAALSKIASDEAVDLLGSYTAEINEKKARGTLNPTDERRIRTLIVGLGDTHNQKAKPYLNTILGVNWTNSILKLAKQYLDNL